MTSIHDDGPGSRSDEVSRRFQRLHQGPDAPPHGPDEPGSVLEAAGIGFCRLRPGPALVAAGGPFRAQLGLAADEPLCWAGLVAPLAPQGRERLEAAVKGAFSTGAPLDLLVPTEPPGQAPRWLALRGRILPGPAPELLLTVREVTGLTQEAQQVLGQERQARLAAEGLSRAKDELLSLISHELRTPLMSILGWTRILALKCTGDAEISAIPAHIERSAKNQLKTVNNLLDLVRINSGRLRIEPRPMHLGRVARQAMEAAGAEAAARGVELLGSLPESAGALRGDPERLLQVVANLLSNALKFTPSGGRVTVSLAEVDDGLELTVADTGIGLEPELLPDLFDRFRAGAAPGRARKGGGLGVGLVLVREIVGLHGGAVSAYSEGPGTGSRFVVRLPAGLPGSGTGGGKKEARPVDPPPAPVAPQGLAGVSILVVDDDAEARAAVAENLRLEGAKVTVSDGARQAYEHLKSTSFDLMVTDIGMPEEDGYSLVRKMRQLGGRTRAIAVTGFVGRGDVAAAMAAGFDVHVGKPVDFDTFVPMVRRLLNP